jgi:RNA polymerase sigma factor (sigma-70 family)
LNVDNKNDAVNYAKSGAHRGKLLNYIRRKVSSPEEAEDILQDVFYQFFNSLNSEPIEKISSWLYRAAENKIIDWYRKKKNLSLDALNERNGDEDDGAPLLHLEDALFDPNESPDEIYIRSMLWPLLSDALDELPKEQSEVFVMHELEGRSFKEISEITGVSTATLITRKHYAILYLREELKEIYEELLYK